MPKGIPRKNSVRHTVENFIIDLVENGHIEDKDLFLFLDQEARKRGYQIAAQQRGIHGTFISFTPA